MPERPQTFPPQNPLPQLPLRSRREFLRNSAVAAGLSAVAGAFNGFLARAAEMRHRRFSGDHPSGGARPPAPLADENTGLKLLSLPKGFRYVSFGWKGDLMDDGGQTPGQHDGMAVIAANEGVLTLCRNHEVMEDGPPFAAPALCYDPKAAGGCTLLQFDCGAGKCISVRPAISGTAKNCAGGPTPWGSWLTCEETVSGPGHRELLRKFDFRREHGWIFEVPAEGAARPRPLKDMGRFVHEAVAVDPATGVVYETEDRQTAGFYRFLPHQPGELAAGGRLQMLQARDDADLRKGCRNGQTWDVSWVDIDDPTGSSPAGNAGKRDELAVFKEGRRKGATTFARLEGCWYADGLIYIVSTSGGDAAAGQLFSYDPVSEQLKLIFESPAKTVLNSPDNVTVSPRGGIVLCEDSGAVPERLHGMTSDGRLFTFAVNNIVLDGEKNGFKGDYRKREWAGACFSPDGRWLFVNIQTPGITFAITGPWEKTGL